MWKIDEALKLIRDIQPHARMNDYNLALAGGVLDKGFSDNDLDIIVIPRSATRKPNKETLIEEFRMQIALRGLVVSKIEELPEYGEGMEGRKLTRLILSNEQIIELIFIDYSLESMG